MRIRLETTVPVVVIVDTETGKVASVHVIDEEVAEFDHNYVMDDDTDEQVSPTRNAGISAWAIRTAQDAEWPAWEFGR